MISYAEIGLGNQINSQKAERTLKILWFYFRVANPWNLSRTPIVFKKMAGLGCGLAIQLPPLYAVILLWIDLSFGQNIRSDQLFLASNQNGSSSSSRLSGVNEEQQYSVKSKRKNRCEM